MALTTKKVTTRRNGFHVEHERHSDASAANTLLTVTTPVGAVRRVLFVTVAYSAAPTHAGVTFSLDSGLGAAYDATIAQGTANARYTLYLGTDGLLLSDDDAFVVSAPAGGAGITSAVSVYTEAL